MIDSGLPSPHRTCDPGSRSPVSVAQRQAPPWDRKVRPIATRKSHRRCSETSSRTLSSRSVKDCLTPSARLPKSAARCPVPALSLASRLALVNQGSYYDTSRLQCTVVGPER